MGGKLYVESELGKGSTFGARIPGVAVAEAGLKTSDTGHLPEEVRSPKSEVLPKRVLVVDDSPINCDVLESLLLKSGVASVKAAGNGREALEALKEPCEVHLCSDSKYLIDGLEKGWAASWRQNGWRRSDKSAAQNPDLWERLLGLLEIHRITEYEWVKGHAGHPENERCDALAVMQREKAALHG